MSRIHAVEPTKVVYAHFPRVQQVENKVAPAAITLVEPEIVKQVAPKVPEKLSVPPAFTISVKAPESVINHPPPLPSVIVPTHDVLSSLVPVQQSVNRSPSPQPQPPAQEEVVMRIKRRTTSVVAKQ